MRAQVTILAAFATMALNAGCHQKPQEIVSGARNQPLTGLDPKQDAMLPTRVTELLQESGHWRPEFQSVTFDDKRGQWQFPFGYNRPDSGIAACIADEAAEQIDILLFPPQWTSYERSESSETVRWTGAIHSAQESLSPGTRLHENSTIYYSVDAEFLKYFGTNDIPTLINAFQESELSTPPLSTPSVNRSGEFWRFQPRYDLIDNRHLPPIDLQEFPSATH
jgi:hypothetical protein